MEKCKEIAGILLFILFFGFLTCMMIITFAEEIDMTSLSKIEQGITAKKSDKSLFRAPSYYVQTEAEDNAREDLFHRITSSQMKNLEVGDKLAGYTTYGGNFYTIYDLLFSSFWLLFAIAIFGGFTVLGLFVLICEIPRVDELLAKTFLGRPSSGKFGMGLLYVVLAIFLFYSGQIGLNLFHKVIPVNQTVTNAEVIDRYQDINYRKYADSTFQLTVQFQDEDGHYIQVDKEVTRQTYDDHLAADSFAISYRQNNPYDIFDQSSSPQAMIQSFLYLESMLALFLIAIIIYSVYMIYKHKRRALDAD